MPKPLENQHILRDYWNERDMTSTSIEKDDLIAEAAGAAGMTVQQVKNWIGNERKRIGIVKKRGARQKEALTVPGKIRKTSGYQMFRSDYLKSETAKSLREAYSNAEVMSHGNQLWQSKSMDEKCHFQSLADGVNENPVVKEETISSRVRKLTTLIKTCVDQLDELGCPSLWIGSSNGNTKQHFSSKLQELSQDETFINYTTASFTKIAAKQQMEEFLAKQLPVNGRTRTRKSNAPKKKKELDTAVNGNLISNETEVVIPTTPDEGVIVQFVDENGAVESE